MEGAALAHLAGLFLVNHITIGVGDGQGDLVALGSLEGQEDVATLGHVGGSASDSINVILVAHQHVAGFHLVHVINIIGSQGGAGDTIAGALDYHVQSAQLVVVILGGDSVEGAGNGIALQGALQAAGGNRVDLEISGAVGHHIAGALHEDQVDLGVLSNGEVGGAHAQSAGAVLYSSVD